MSEITTKDYSESDVKTLTEPFLTALALGAKLPAPSGTHAFRLKYYDGSEIETRDWDIGYYQTEEEAMIGLANWIINEWETVGATPWESEKDLKNKEKIMASNDPMEEYLKTYTFLHIVTHYFSMSSDWYEINLIEISKSPDAWATGTND